MKRLFYLAIALSVFTTSLSVAYYFFIFLPNKEEQKRIDKQTQQNNLFTCLQAAETTKNNSVLENCSSQISNDMCLMRDDIKASIELTYKREQQNCYQLFSN